MNAIEVFPNCTAEVKAKFAGSYLDKTLTEYAKGHLFVEGGSGRGYVQLYFSKPFALEDWVFAKVLDAGCKAESFAF